MTASCNIVLPLICTSRFGEGSAIAAKCIRTFTLCARCVYVDRRHGEDLGCTEGGIDAISHRHQTEELAEKTG